MSQFFQGWTITNVLTIIGLLYVAYHILRFLVTLGFMIWRDEERWADQSNDRKRISNLEYEVRKLSISAKPLVKEK